MKTLIINGSPRKNGDTASMIAQLRQGLDGEITEISAYRDNISPCIDCRLCQKERACAIKDGMQAIYADDFDNVVIAAPIHCSMLPGPVVSLASRFQMYYSAKKFLDAPVVRRRKKGALIIAGGGDGSPEPGIEFARTMFRFMNAEFADEHIAMSYNTDDVPACEDAAASAQIAELARYLNG